MSTLSGPANGGTDLNDKTPWNEPAVPEVIIDYAEGD